MKEYIKPEIEQINYDSEDCLTISDEITKNGKYNTEGNYTNWNDNII